TRSDRDWSSDVCSSDLDRRATIRSTQYLDAVAVRVFDSGVAVGNRDGAHVQLRRVERQQEGQAVVDAWVCIDDYRERHPSRLGKIGRASCRERGVPRAEGAAAARRNDHKL